MGEPAHIIGLDVGTTSTKAVLCRWEGRRAAVPAVLVDTAVRAHGRTCGGFGRVEQDPDEVLEAVLDAVGHLVRKNGIPPNGVAAVSFGGILHSLIPVDGEGSPLAPALLWADLRSVRQSEELASSLDAREVMSRTGCPIHPLYYPPRLKWFAEERPDIAAETFKYVSIKEYILHRLFGRWVVDRSTASGTGIWNMATMDWDETMLDVAALGRERFSDVVDTIEVLEGLDPRYASRMGLSPGTRGVVGASDGPLSHLASIGFDEERISLSVGTSAALRRKISRPMVLHGSGTWCYYLMENYWLVGGVVHDAGFVVDWFADTFLGGRGDEGALFRELDELIEGVPPGSEGVRFLPFLVGEQCPSYNPRARAAVLGMSFEHGRRHILRAMVEGIAYRLNAVYTILSAGDDIDLVVSGGILKSPAWLALTADYLGRRLWKPRVPMAAAWGSVLLALKSLGIVRTAGELDALGGADDPAEPDRAVHETYVRLRREYDRYYEKLFRER